MVIEAVGFRVTLSYPAWRLTREQEMKQAERNQEAMGGFIVACLKRALKYWNLALNATARVEQSKLLPATDVSHYRADLLSVRQDILSLMQRFRSKLSG